MGVSVDASDSACYALVQSARTYLDDGALAGNFEDLTLSCLAVSELDVHDLGEPMEKSWLVAALTGGCAYDMIVSLTWGT